MAVSTDDFEKILNRHVGVINMPAFAVAVSGGPDSMALAWLVSHYGLKHNKKIYAYTVDHGLRPDSAIEAQTVADWVKEFPNVEHKILRWEGEKPKTRILEEARNARYDLLVNAAKQDGCGHILVAHHRDDQAETFLIRLAKGSGVDGLAGMAEVQEWDGIKIIRPLLSFSKQDLIDLCMTNHVHYVDDPTNKNEAYLRPRLRAAQEILEQEGLTSKRLAVTAKRIARAREALEFITQKALNDVVVKADGGCFVLDINILKQQQDDIVIRLILKLIDQFHGDEDYGPRLERVENLVERILHDVSFRGATLAGCIFAMNDSKKQLTIRKEV